MCVTEDSLLLKGLQQSMISLVPSKLGATVSMEGWTYSYGGMYELSNNRSGILGLQGLVLASLVKNDGATSTSNGASAITSSISEDPPAGISSSGGAQASLRAS